MLKYYIDVYIEIWYRYYIMLKYYIDVQYCYLVIWLLIWDLYNVSHFYSAVSYAPTERCLIHMWYLFISICKRVEVQMHGFIILHTFNLLTITSGHTTVHPDGIELSK